LPTPRSDPRSAERVLQRARRLRELFARLFDAMRRRQRPEARDVRLFNAFIGSALRRRRLDVGTDGAEWRSADRGAADFDRLIHPLVLAAADFAHVARATAHQAVCGRRLRLVLRRHQPNRLAPVVHHAELRQPRQGAPVPSAHDGIDSLAG
jgi:Putative stress-induced transcription regulator